MILDDGESKSGFDRVGVKNFYGSVYIAFKMSESIDLAMFEHGDSLFV